jgi:hypothetical protein
MLHSGDINPDGLHLHPRAWQLRFTALLGGDHCFHKYTSLSYVHSVVTKRKDGV